MRITYLLIGLVAISLFGCEREEPEMFTPERFIKFKFNAEPQEDDYYKIDYTFAFESDAVKEKEITVPVEFRGYTLTEDLHFAVNVDKEKTTLSDNAYVLETEQVFAADENEVDSMRVKLLRDPSLKLENKTLWLKLVSNGDFQTYMPDSLFVEITVGDIFMRPTWWDSAVENAYLGTYSQLKYEAFAEITGIRDFGVLDPSAKRHYAIMFKRELEKNPRVDEDGSNMSVTITG